MRAITAPLVLAAAVGVPYVASNSDQLGQMWQADSDAAATSHLDPESLSNMSNYGAPSVQGYGTVSPTAPVRSLSLAEVIRFDVDKNWVFQRWQRKTTSLAELDLFGVRVPLVTGTALHDLAGSLTYYFDAQGMVQRISLMGTTGNTTQLEMLVTQHYGLQLQGTPIAGQRVYQLLQGDQVISELVIRPASVLRSNAPNESFNVDLQLQRPGVTRPLPKRNAPVDSLISQTPQQQATPQAEKASQPAAEQEKAKEEVDDKSDEPFWRAYMPRSRVPEKQIENLDRRGRF